MHLTSWSHINTFLRGLRISTWIYKILSRPNAFNNPMKLLVMTVLAAVCEAVHNTAEPPTSTMLSEMPSVRFFSARIRELDEQEELKRAIVEVDARVNRFAEFVKSEPIIDIDEDGNFTVETPPERPSSAPLKG